jgi:hypothetical protein
MAGIGARNQGPEVRGQGSGVVPSFPDPDPQHPILMPDP